jgi:hypothetical protein
VNTAGKPDHQLLVLCRLRRRFQDVVLGAGIPLVQVVHAAHLRLQHLFGAPEARTHGRIHRATRRCNSKPCLRQDRILFGVHADAQIVCLTGLVGLVAIGAATASAIQAVHHVLWSAVIPGGDDPIIEDDQRTDAVAFAVGPQPDRDRNVHEIFVAVLARIACRLRLDRRSPRIGRRVCLILRRCLITRSSGVPIMLRLVRSSVFLWLWTVDSPLLCRMDGNHRHDREIVRPLVLAAQEQSPAFASGADLRLFRC